MAKTPYCDSYPACPIVTRSKLIGSAIIDQDNPAISIGTRDCRVRRMARIPALVTATTAVSLLSFVIPCDVEKSTSEMNIGFEALKKPDIRTTPINSRFDDDADGVTPLYKVPLPYPPPNTPRVRDEREVPAAHDERDGSRGSAPGYDFDDGDVLPGQ